jgi:hypothetical protein
MPSLLQVLVLLLAFSYAYLTYVMKSQLERSAAQEHTPSMLQAWPRTERKSCLPDISSGWLDIIAMSELPEGELAGVGVDAPPQGPFPRGDVRRHPEAPGHSYLGQAAAEPTSGQHQVPSEDPLFNEIEIDDGEAPQLPASSGSQAAPTVTTGGVVGVPLQQHRPCEGVQ